MHTLKADPVSSPQLHDRKKSLEIYGYQKQMLYSLIQLQARTIKAYK
jgi:hypothetical protein